MRPIHLALLSTLLASPSMAASPKPWDIFLLFGQSNMAGAPAAESQDKTANPRIKVLAFNNCSGLGRTFDQWYAATPPLHNCYEGLGPGDWFSRTLLDTSDKLGLGIDTIGLVPCAFSGVDISFFRKGIRSSRRKDFKIVPSDTGVSAYLWMLDRLKLALQKGRLRGVLLHQGEADWSDTARKAWPGRVKEILDDLKKDLGVGDIPLVAGELRYTNASSVSSCCQAHNTYVHQLETLIPNTAVASASGLTGLSDAYHFDAASQRTFGHRYCAAMVPLLKSTSIAAPLPAIDGFRLDRKEGRFVLRSEEPVRASLSSVDGRTLELGSGRELEVRTEELRPGVYVVRAVAGTASETRKILVDR